MRTTTVGAICWIGCLQYFAAEAVAIHGWSGAYDLGANYISDLGAVGCGAPTLCSPLHALMNASFLLQGALILGGAALVRPLFPPGRRFDSALALIGASGAGVFLVGLAPEDAAPRLHFVGAVENLFCCNAGMAAIGAALLGGRRAARTTGLVALAAGLVGAAGFACLAAGVDFGLGVGGVERVTAYPFPLWLAGMGARLTWRGALPGATHPGLA